MGLNPNYIVGVGETIRDVVINATGNFDNWDTILEANEFNDWTPPLLPGQSIIIPDDVIIDSNTLQDKKAYPANNGALAGGLDALREIFDLLNDRWLLKDGFWDDSGIWIDTDVWNDNP